MLVFACGFLFSFSMIKLLKQATVPYERLLETHESYLLETIRIPYLLVLLGFAFCLNLTEFCKLIVAPTRCETTAESAPSLEVTPGRLIPLEIECTNT